MNPSIVYAQEEALLGGAPSNLQTKQQSDQNIVSITKFNSQSMYNSVFKDRERKMSAEFGVVTSRRCDPTVVGSFLRILLLLLFICYSQFLLLCRHSICGSIVVENACPFTTVARGFRRFRSRFLALIAGRVAADMVYYRVVLYAAAHITCSWCCWGDYWMD
jgi:hypothetical protein